MATQPVTPPSNTPPPTTKPTLPPSTPLTPILAKLPTKDKNNSLILGVGILFLILIGGIAFLFYQNQQLAQQLSGNQTQTSSDLSQTIDDSMSDWETYTNTKYNYQLKYPQNFDITEGGMGTGDLENSGAIIIYEKTQESPVFSPNISIDVITLDNQSLEDRIQNHYTAISTHTIQEDAKNYFKDQFGINYTENKAVKQITSSTLANQDSNEYSIEGNFVKTGLAEYLTPIKNHKYIWIDKDYTFLIYLSDNPTTNQIISTFQFTDQTSSMSDWKTYTSNDYGFTIKHPPDYIVETSQLGTDQKNYYAIIGKGTPDEVTLKVTPINSGPGLTLEVNWDLEKEITLGSISWTYRYSSTGYGDGPNYQPHSYILLTTSNNNFSYSLEVWQQDELSKTQDQILSTFQFTN